jgi:hypothetical protein
MFLALGQKLSPGLMFVKCRNGELTLCRLIWNPRFSVLKAGQFGALPNKIFNLEELNTDNQITHYEMVSVLDSTAKLYT